MGIYEETRFSIVCDDCYDESSPSETERGAKKYAVEDGFVERDGKWFCEKCARKKKNKTPSSDAAPDSGMNPMHRFGYGRGD